MLLAGFVGLRQVKDSQSFKYLMHLTPQHLIFATSGGFRRRRNGTVIWLKAAEIFLTCVEGEGKIIIETESVCFVFALII